MSAHAIDPARAEHTLRYPRKPELAGHRPDRDGEAVISGRYAAPCAVTGVRAPRPHLGPETDGNATLLSLLSGMAEGFASDPHPADEALASCLRRVAEAFGLDCVFLWPNVDDCTRQITHTDRMEDAHRASMTPLPLVSVPSVVSRLRAGQCAWFRRIEDVHDPVDRNVFQLHGLCSAAVFPLSWRGTATELFVGALAVGTRTREREWGKDIVAQLRLAAAVIGQALARDASSQALGRAREDLDHLRERRAGEPGVRRTMRAWQAPCASRPGKNEMPTERGQERAHGESETIIGRSKALRTVLEAVRQVAATDSTVLLLGETGAGKELIATEIHKASRRSGREMVCVNCAAIPTALMESELFGRERGAYTGALTRQIGRFELAERSTLFLDEIGELPAEVQVKLLRALEERRIERLGSPASIPIDVRIVAATHRDLEQCMAQGAFRPDLFYRLNVFPIRVPPLRERREDIPLLVWSFVHEFSRALGKRIDTIPSEHIAALQEYPWPGNIRELRNVVERAVILATGTELTLAPPTRSPGATVRRSERLFDVEREHVRSVLEGARWRIRGAGGAAERLGLPPTTLETRMARLGLRRPKPV